MLRPWCQLSPLSHHHRRLRQHWNICIARKLLKRAADCLRAIPESIIRSWCFVRTHSVAVQCGALPLSSYEAVSHHSRLWDPPGSNWDTRKWFFFFFFSPAMTCLEFAARAKWQHFSLYVKKDFISLYSQRGFPTMNPFPFKFNNLLFNCYHLFWQNNYAEHAIFFPLFPQFTFDDLPLWILSYQRIWDTEWEMNMTIVN